MMEDRISVLESDLDRLRVKLHQLAWKLDGVDRKIPEEPSIDTEAELYDLRGKFLSFENTLYSLRISIEELDEQISGRKGNIPTLPDTNLFSHSLWKRLLTIWGHSIIGNIVLAIIVYGFIFIFGLSLGSLT